MGYRLHRTAALLTDIFLLDETLEGGGTM
jgi:hypothetical protein